MFWFVFQAVTCILRCIKSTICKAKPQCAQACHCARIKLAQVLLYAPPCTQANLDRQIMQTWIVFQQIHTPRKKQHAQECRAICQFAMTIANAWSYDRNHEQRCRKKTNQARLHSKTYMKCIWFLQSVLLECCQFVSNFEIRFSHRYVSLLSTLRLNTHDNVGCNTSLKSELCIPCQWTRHIMMFGLKRLQCNICIKLRKCAEQGWFEDHFQFAVQFWM